MSVRIYINITYYHRCVFIKVKILAECYGKCILLVQIVSDIIKHLFALICYSTSSNLVAGTWLTEHRMETSHLFGGFSHEAFGCVVPDGRYRQHPFNVVITHVQISAR